MQTELKRPAYNRSFSSKHLPFYTVTGPTYPGGAAIIVTSPIRASTVAISISAISS
jgi:hypothetical protein